MSMANFSIPWLDGLIEQINDLDGAWAAPEPPIENGQFKYIAIGVENTDGLDELEPIMIEYARQTGKNVVIFYFDEGIHGATFYHSYGVVHLDTWEWASNLEGVHGKAHYA